jgi:hypothetical protein
MISIVSQRPRDIPNPSVLRKVLYFMKILAPEIPIYKTNLSVRLTSEGRSINLLI